MKITGQLQHSIQVPETTGQGGVAMPTNTTPETCSVEQQNWEGRLTDNMLSPQELRVARGGGWGL